MEWQRLETLKNKLEKEEDFQGVFQYFFDHLGENPAFINAGVSASAAMLKTLTPVIENTVQHIVQETITILDTNISEVPGQHFFHGPVVTNAGICILMYFDDVKIGMIYFTRGLGSGLMHYGRFSTLAVEDPNAIVLPTRNQTGH